MELMEVMLKILGMFVMKLTDHHPPKFRVDTKKCFFCFLEKNKSFNIICTAEARGVAIFSRKPSRKLRGSPRGT